MHETLYGLSEDWHQSSFGHEMIYSLLPDRIPTSYAARVIYELRLDIARLNTEVMESRS